MRTPNVSPRLAAEPLRGLVTAAIQQMQPPRVRGLRQSWTTIKVRKGETHPCAVLERIITEHAHAGGDVEDALGVARAITLGIRHAYGAIPNAFDYKAASLREQKAQCRVDPMQLVAQNLADVTEADLERLVVMLDEQAEATTQMQLAVQVELHERAMARAAARRRLGLNTPRSA